MGEEHGAATAIHKIHAWEHANAAARTGESVTAEDIGKISWQQDTDIFYVLKDTAPTWVELTGGAFQGDTGDQGDTGAAGPQGDTGIQGDTGSQGIKGDTGAQGDTGDQGIQGDTGGGVKGDTGDKGDTGVAGIDGFYPNRKLIMSYDFNTTTTGPPSSGEVRFNNSDPWSAETIWIHGTDRNGADQTYLLDFFKPGDVIWFESEVDSDYCGFYVRHISFASGYYTLTTYSRDVSGTFGSGEDIRFVFLMTYPTPDSSRERINIATHADGTWYDITGSGFYAETDMTILISAIIVGHSDDATGATWAYRVFNWLRDDGGVRTSGTSSVTVITEYDSAYDVRLYNTGGAVTRAQVRRSGGTDYDIDWSVTARYAMWEAPY